jgi:hypothetical protein
MSAEEKVEAPKVDAAEAPKAVEQKEYLLTIRVKFQAFDDAEARKVAEGEMDGMRWSDRYEAKFQRLRKDGPPEKVEL